MTVVVNEITFSPDDVTITYAHIDAIRDVGGEPVLRACQISMPREHGSFPEVQELYELAQDLVRDASAQYDQSSIWQPALPFEEDQDEDDEEMGS